MFTTLKRIYMVKRNSFLYRVKNFLPYPMFYITLDNVFNFILGVWSLIYIYIYIYIYIIPFKILLAKTRWF